jgi:hypothetical protein
MTFIIKINKVILRFSIFFIILFASFFLFVYKLNNSTQFSDNITKLFPIEFRAYIKNNFFKNAQDYEFITSDTSLFDKENFNTFFNYKVNNLKFLDIPFYSIYNNRPEPFFVDFIDFDNFLAVSTFGEFFLIDNKIDKKINIETNFKDFITYKNNLIQIRDILINNNEIYVSYVKEVKKNCYNVSILRSNLEHYHVKKLLFSTFYTHNQCVDNSILAKLNSPLDRKSIWPIKGHRSVVINQAGGSMTMDHDNNDIYLTSGVFGARSLAQDRQSLFGKIIKINILNGISDIFSLGHRNPQGIFYFKKNSQLISTEHGPLGGDEINLISKNKNYGWPISSYGNHYNGLQRPEAPLHKSHKKYGFEEPLFVFESRTAPTSIINFNLNDIDESINFFLVSSLKGKNLFLFSFNGKMVSLIQKISLNERIRDISLMNDRLLIGLETSKRILIIDL